MAADEKDKRDFIRVPLKTEVAVRTGGRVIRAAVDLNLSMNGIAFRTDQAVPAEGAACTVQIFLTGLEQRIAIEAEGAVVRTVPGSLAVEFTELDLDSYHHLRRLILSNTNDPDRAEREFEAHWGIRRPRPA